MQQSCFLPPPSIRADIVRQVQRASEPRTGAADAHEVYGELACQWVMMDALCRVSSDSMHMQ
jgi:hypothetical protein